MSTSSADPTGAICIVEGTTGDWRHHIAKVSTEHRSLCGKPTRATDMPWESWGMQTHLNESYCGICVQRAAKLPKPRQLSKPNQTR